MGVVVGDARSIPLPDGSVQTCVTSPPYFGLRDYGVDGQIGSEDSLDAFLATMVDVFREVGRVLRDDGTVWLNLGDSFAGGHSGEKSAGDGPGALSSGLTRKPGKRKYRGAIRTRPIGDFRPKCKMLVPHRLAIALCDDGWIVRQDIVWAKPNPMPESVTDRPTTAHEFVFLLAKQPRYYYDAEAVREPHDFPKATRRSAKVSEAEIAAFHGKAPGNRGRAGLHHAGRNKRSVWHIPSHPFPDAHFATFPPKLVEPCILAGTPQKACPTCGAGWVREVKVTGQNRADEGRIAEFVAKGVPRTSANLYLVGCKAGERETIGFAPNCGCPNNDGSGKALVFDPFAGSGTTGVVARQMGREFFGVELNPEYAAMANARIRSEGEGRTRAVDGDGRVSEQLVMGI